METEQIFVVGANKTVPQKMAATKTTVKRVLPTTNWCQVFYTRVSNACEEGLNNGQSSCWAPRMIYFGRQGSFESRRSTGMYAYVPVVRGGRRIRTGRRRRRLLSSGRMGGTRWVMASWRIMIYLSLCRLDTLPMMMASTKKSSSHMLQLLLQLDDTRPCESGGEPSGRRNRDNERICSAHTEGAVCWDRVAVGRRRRTWRLAARRSPWFILSLRAKI